MAPPMLTALAGFRSAMVWINATISDWLHGHMASNSTCDRFGTVAATTWASPHGWLPRRDFP